jgi:hypothetical protein
MSLPWVISALVADGESDFHWIWKSLTPAKWDLYVRLAFLGRGNEIHLRGLHA